VTLTGSSTHEIKTVPHPVSDLAGAKEVYAALLGEPPQTDGSHYVGDGRLAATVAEPDGNVLGLLQDR